MNFESVDICRSSHRAQLRIFANIIGIFGSQTTTAATAAFKLPTTRTT